MASKFYRMSGAASTLAAVAVLLAAPAAAPAAFMVAIGPSTISGTGLGAVNTILTLQSPRDSTTETGAVSFNAGTMADVITTGGDALTGSSQTKTITETALATTSSGFAFSTNDLRLVVNLNEPGSESPPTVTVLSLTATFFNAAGLVVDTATLTSVPLSLVQISPGIGQSGQGFRITGIDSTAFRVGLAASIGDASGGPETFYVGDGGKKIQAVPVPATALAVAAALPLLGLGGRFRRRLDRA